MSLKSELLRFLRVPHAPTAPAGDEDVHVFRAAPGFFRYQLLQWALKTMAAVVGLFVGLELLGGVPQIWSERIQIGGYTIGEDVIATIIGVIEGFAVFGVVFQATMSLALLRLDFEQRWYLVSDRSLRIREGLVRLHEKTMTFANIQHVTIEQGPLQRLLGIADLRVRTAGGGGSGEQAEEKKKDLHVAYFRGVSDAEQIRDTIRERMRRHVDAGLGDPDDRAPRASRANALGAPASATPALPAAPAVHAYDASLLAAARALADEARALREHVAAKA